MVDLMLQTIIYELIEELSSKEVHYMIYGEYNFFYYGQMVQYAPIYLSNETVSAIEFTEDGFKVSILMYGHKLEEKLHIKLRYHRIFKICRYQTACLGGEQVLFVK